MVPGAASKPTMSRRFASISPGTAIMLATLPRCTSTRCSPGLRKSIASTRALDRQSLAADRHVASREIADRRQTGPLRDNRRHTKIQRRRKAAIAVVPE